MEYFFTINKRPGLPHLVLKLLSAVGIADEKKSRHRLTLVLLIFVLMIAIPKICFGYSSFEASIVGIAELLFQINNFLGLFIISARNEDLKRLIACAGKLADEVFQSGHNDMVQLLTSQHKQMHTITRCYCLLIFYTACIYAFVPIGASCWSYYQSVHQNSSVHYVLHMEENFYGLSIRTSLGHYLIFAIPMTLTSFVCAYVGNAKIMTIFNLTNYCTAYFQLVALKLQHESESKIDHRGVRAIVTMHQQALLYANLLERIMSPIMLMQIILCVLMSSSMMLYFTFTVSRTT
ncbi:uncharacterized protein LOC126565177 [Anopheles maculipalpis]|uniref:uncharacterized protein LOC126565177 n=1 Tax=Anopheles maculipalpis TaxID=1496333 RepID=UPI00215971F1|nr:uncharacterized protein LOC126565177 [Anopheles maculipalpis]